MIKGECGICKQSCVGERLLFGCLHGFRVANCANGGDDGLEKDIR